MFCVGDTCCLKDDAGVVGTVERTAGDIDYHEPDPQSEYDEPLTKHRGISDQDFIKFLDSGIPPHGTVLAGWAHKVELIPESKLAVTDRAFYIGDVVKRSPLEPMSGTVVASTTRCTLIPVQNLMAAPAVMNDSNVSGSSFTRLGLLHDVPSTELRYSKEYMEGNLIIYNDWVGRVEQVDEEVAIRLENGSVVIPAEKDELETIGHGHDMSVGDQVRAKKGNLRRGLWKYGAYDPNVKPEGTIVESRPIEITVHWLAPRLGGEGESSVDASEPPPQLGLDELDSGGVVVYDMCRCPTSANALSPEEWKCEFGDISVGDRVRFRDLSAACVKYDGSPTILPNGLPQGKLERVPRTESLGYDMNVFCVSHTSTDLVVQWQDLSISTHASVNLIPDIAVDDEDGVWPGEIICTKEANPNPTFMEPSIPSVNVWYFEPLKVGVVQTVNAADRIATVRWFTEGCVAFLEDDLLPGSKTGSKLSEPEEISLYDIRSSEGLNRRRGDGVIVHDESLASHCTGATWFGIVTNLGLDGLLTVRLSASNPVIDIKVRAENVTLAYSSDMDDFDGADAHSYEDDTDDEEDEDEDEAVYVGGLPPVRVRWVEYVVTNDGQVEMRDEVGDDNDWSTEDSDDSMDCDSDELVFEDLSDDDDDDDDQEDGDIADEMDTSDTTPDERAPGTITPSEALAKLIEERTTAGSSNIAPPVPAATEPGHDSLTHNSSQPPEAFSVLTADPPTDHHFVGRSYDINATRTRRILKEHKILQSSLPEGIYVRTWDSRLDLLRVLIVGPVDTPYEFAPFVIDFCFSSSFPSSPPDTFFHSWTYGAGPVNPNLYEDGKICLSLLGTWHSADHGENWQPATSTVLQILVSLLGLVLVKQPYYNEAGYESRAGREETVLPSAFYTERVYFRTRGFINHALTHDVGCLAEIIDWLYVRKADGAPRLLERAIEAAQDVERNSARVDENGNERDGLRRISAGALIPLRRQLAALRELRRLEH